MNSKKLPIILCAVFAAVAIVFTSLAVINFTKKPDEITVDENAGGYVFSGDVQTDAPGASLDAVISNDMKAQGEYPAGILEKFKQAYSINNNLVGWLSIPGTELDTAVLQSDDNSYYLKKDFYNIPIMF